MLTRVHIGIIGAGLAGASCARALARAGFQVTLLESEDGPAHGASGNPVGILHPLISKDFNLASQWIELGIQTSLRWLSELNALAKLKGLGLVGQSCGVLQMNQDCSELVHWTSNGAWIRPARWVAACLLDAEQYGAKISYGAKVLRVSPEAQVDVMFGGDQSKIYTYKFDAVVFCNAASIESLVPNAQLRLNSIRGTISSYRLDEKYSLPHIICADGYATPVIEGEMAVGASYERLDNLGGSGVVGGAGDSHDRVSEELDSRSNLDRLRVISELLTARCKGLNPTDRTSIRGATLDRMPHVGRLLDESVALTPVISRIEQMPRSQRLWVLGGLGSRGLSTAALGAEMILAQMTSGTLPVPTRLAAAVDPARFALRRHQRRKIG
jgi:tRNA 5-methylaminomethyl-2-thiouridine biosynthesis bifunctional protein